VQNGIKFICPFEISKNRQKSQKSTEDQRNVFGAMSWISFKIHQYHLKFDGNHEPVSIFDHSSIVEELSFYFRYTSGKIEISNCLKVKSELCSPQSLYQFKHNLNEEELGYYSFIRA
jgi:hypothetical protein